MYCNALGFIPAFANVVQNVWRKVCGVITFGNATFCVLLYVFCALSPAGCYPCFTVWYFSLAFLLRERSWRTRRMARHKRNVSDLPYAASPFYCAAFFVKEQRAVLRYGTEKGEEAFQYRVGLFSPKCEDCPHQFCLQPFAYFFVHSKINISSLIIELPHLIL